MIFTNPIAWYLLLAAIPIILLYLPRIRRRRETVSTMIFWRQVFGERRSRPFWRRLRLLLSLFLSLLFLTLLVGALADPVPASNGTVARLVIVVDNSAGMNAWTDRERRTKLEIAKNELRGLPAVAGTARPTAILTAGGPPRIVVGFTDHPETLRRGVEAISATDHPSSLLEAIELARRLLVSEDDSSILVYTDGCAAGLAALQADPKIRFVSIGRPLDNIGITRFQPRRMPDDAVGYEILVEAANFGTIPVSARIEIEFDGRMVDVVPLTLEPNKPQTRILRDATPQGGLIHATLKPTAPARPDPFPVDDTAVAFLPERPKQRIYFFGEDDFFLRTVLQSQPNVDWHEAAEWPASVPDGAVLVLHRVVPESMPPGNVLVIDPRSGCNLFELGDPLDVPLVADETGDSPLMRFVHLNNLLIPGARRLTPGNADDGAPAEILAATAESFPIYARWKSASGKVLVLTADLSRGDLALRTAFPIMISQALAEFRGSGGEWSKAYSTGESVRVHVDTTDDRVVLRSPAGRRQMFPVESGRVAFGMLPECGVWDILRPEPANKESSGSEAVLGRLACNLVDAVESNLRLAPDSFYEAPPPPEFRTAGRPIRVWLMLLALFLTTTEWFLYQRRWID